EWFGAEYVAVILTFAGGLAERVVDTYDGSGQAPIITDNATTVMSVRDEYELRREIERLKQRGHGDAEIAAAVGLSLDAIDDHVAAMRESSFYDLRYKWTAVTWPRRRSRAA
ncbi:MAG TPA: hypothetical protein PKB03_10740, partial [Baekduia sp.]|nr:hypothetical protein [Baekduia sp.]